MSQDSHTSFADTATHSRTVSDFVEEFVSITGLHPRFDDIYRSELSRLVAYLGCGALRSLTERRREFLAHVNRKFRLNAPALAQFYREAASSGFTFHYHHKCQIQRAFDLRDEHTLNAVLDERSVPRNLRSRLLGTFNPIDESATLGHLANECRTPTKLRKEKGDRDIEGEIIKAHFSAFMWGSLPVPQMHRFFDPLFDQESYRPSFWDELHVRSPQLFSRDNALHILRVRSQTTTGTTGQLRDAIAQIIARLYGVIDNYGFLAILIEPLFVPDREITWEIAADTILFGEKHRLLELQKYYFRWDRVRDETAAYIKGLDLDAARFELVNEGFTYKDCFVISDAHGHVQRLLLMLQKNERDETPIPCPTCRSDNVRGNSYSSLGVRSWECRNELCPDRSKYNRGKRYSFRALAMQRAIEDERNDIPVESVRRWTRDVLTSVPDTEIADMLARHYSMHGDTIHTHNWDDFCAAHIGRRVKHHTQQLVGHPHDFWNGPFFSRYVTIRPKAAGDIRNLGDSAFQVIVGDSGAALRSFPASTFDGAVTSPPYYNARDYAQWPNIYCYLYDVLNINQEIFRTLKPGALYLYNIFDYFDNDNTTVFSAMGQRRVILSAYTVDLFRRIGFECIGNIVWDKGDIEGKRGFNAGNFSPYYQAPFNCWEHVLVFRKPSPRQRKGRVATTEKRSSFAGQVLRQQPLFKMVRGENVHGHSAPFPDAIPELLISRLPKGSTIVDPFAGSLTTGRVAERYGVRSVCIERSEEYCRLGLRLREEARQEAIAASRQLRFF